MHYNRRTVQQIEHAYVHAGRRLLPRFRKKSMAALKNISLNPSISAGVGARFVITFDEVKDIISRLKDQLTERYRENMTDREVSRYHSQYLLYTHLYQSILSSMRAINQPYDLYRAWERSAKSKQDIHCCLSDKDSRYTDRARLAPLIDQLAEQFANFRLHLEYLPSKLQMSEPWIFALGPDHPFFVILANHQVQPLTTSWLKEALKHFTGFDIPANFHRAFLANELFIRGCPVEVIDAHIGHANIGELPFGRCSTFDYDQHFRVLTSALVDIHDALGLEPIGSRIVPFEARLGIPKP
jgi:hypothetical protein